MCQQVPHDYVVGWNPFKDDVDASIRKAVTN